ncbi:hypothetical protein AA13595_0015 [Gluconacetobacter johannae DSM 13595]|uniref:DUF1134 domain-containing protein n=2 Tax=Gluconacetobacter johannae TaxID=112140 RepID=A0A7W4J4Y4_9PROT|nr:hypothetical protein [Gluconacetobacter johannae]MBB2174805.1 hypothetical protein [Gluconacetobacter johannae]GBQ79399.1 hypothetical protein AA13595_0015 [Gluconacetobacter johannae DSM 13595]
MRVRKWFVIVALLTTTAVSLGGCADDPKEKHTGQSGRIPDAYVKLREFQVAFVGSGGGGNGTITFRGKTYPLKFGGLGIGGFGVSSVDATGEVFNLHDIRKFPGTYGRARYGFAVGTASSGEMWLQNEAGVIMHLRAKRAGLMLSMGGDALVISMK